MMFAKGRLVAEIYAAGLSCRAACCPEIAVSSKYKSQMRELEPQIDLLLEDEDIFGPALEADANHRQALRQQKDANDILADELDALNALLARQIRRKEPRLTVSLDNGLIVSYKHHPNRIRFQPNVSNREFTVNDSPFERRFRRYYGHTLGSDIGVIAQSVADFFRSNYRSLK